jgi:hypothetical protein
LTVDFCNRHTGTRPHLPDPKDCSWLWVFWGQKTVIRGRQYESYRPHGRLPLAPPRQLRRGCNLACWPRNAGRNDLHTSISQFRRTGTCTWIAHRFKGSKPVKRKDRQSTLQDTKTHLDSHQDDKDTCPISVRWKPHGIFFTDPLPGPQSGLRPTTTGWTPRHHSL